MTKEIYDTMMIGLLATLKEQLCVFGMGIETRQTKGTINDLEIFWNCKNELSDIDYSGEVKKMMRIHSAV